MNLYKKRLSAAVLSLVMLLSLYPVPVSATDVENTMAVPESVVETVTETVHDTDLPDNAPTLPDDESALSNGEPAENPDTDTLETLPDTVETLPETVESLPEADETLPGTDEISVAIPENTAEPSAESPDTAETSAEPLDSTTETIPGITESFSGTAESFPRAAESSVDLPDEYAFPAVLLDEDSPVYVLMNIPYADFYAAELGDGAAAVDAVTSATYNKPRTGGLAGGSYHVNSDGSDISGIIYPVSVPDMSVLANMTQITDESSVSITVTNRGQESTTKPLKTEKCKKTGGVFSMGFISMQGKTPSLCMLKQDSHIIYSLDTVFTL